MGELILTLRLLLSSSEAHVFGTVSNGPLRAKARVGIIYPSAPVQGIQICGGVYMVRNKVGG